MPIQAKSMKLLAIRGTLQLTDHKLWYDILYWLLIVKLMLDIYDWCWMATYCIRYTHFNCWKLNGTLSCWLFYTEASIWLAPPPTLTSDGLTLTLTLTPHTSYVCPLILHKITSLTQISQASGLLTTQSWPSSQWLSRSVPPEPNPTHHLSFSLTYLLRLTQSTTKSFPLWLNLASLTLH